jgi:hypothetical protein
MPSKKNKRTLMRKRRSRLRQSGGSTGASTSARGAEPNQWLGSFDNSKGDEVFTIITEKGRNKRKIKLMDTNNSHLGDGIYNENTDELYIDCNILFSACMVEGGNIQWENGDIWTRKMAPYPIEGVWVDNNSDNITYEIYVKRLLYDESDRIPVMITFFDGQTQKLIGNGMYGDNRIYWEEQCKAIIDEGGNIKWKNGDIWTRIKAPYPIEGVWVDNDSDKIMYEIVVLKIKEGSSDEGAAQITMITGYNDYVEIEPPGDEKKENKGVGNTAKSAINEKKTGYSDNWLPEVVAADKVAMNNDVKYYDGNYIPSTNCINIKKTLNGNISYSGRQIIWKNNKIRNWILPWSDSDMLNWKHNSRFKDRLIYITTKKINDGTLTQDEKNILPILLNNIINNIITHHKINNKIDLENTKENIFMLYTLFFIVFKYIKQFFTNNRIWIKKFIENIESIETISEGISNVPDDTYLLYDNDIKNIIDKIKEVKVNMINYYNGKLNNATNIKYLEYTFIRSLKESMEVIEALMEGLMEGLMEELINEGNNEAKKNLGKVLCGFAGIPLGIGIAALLVHKLKIRV